MIVTPAGGPGHPQTQLIREQLQHDDRADEHEEVPPPRNAINAANVPHRSRRINQLVVSTFTASAIFVSHEVRIDTSHRNRSVSQRSKNRKNVGNVSTPMAVMTKYATMINQNFPVRPK
jgi:hypothetical protein